MAHYAIIDENNIVIQVFPGKEDGDDGIDNWEQKYSEITKQYCKRTSYNTYGGVHKLGGTPFRKNFAGIGFTYNQIRDAFIPPKPFESWVLNEETCLWEPPISLPEDACTTGDCEGLKQYAWDELTTSWVEVSVS